ncbi:MAG: hypothetical protein KAV87_37375 [Desulfobacteraceae bacterium]|nr:hypothetical protein [Desulfobacteraceae bacterium]
MCKRRSQQKIPSQTLNPDGLRVWQHPTLVNAIGVLEVFSLEPGDGKLAVSLVLAFDQLIRHLKRDKSDLTQVQTQAMLATRDRAFEWLRNEVDSVAYNPDPSRSTNQIDKALNCALLLFCAQFLQIKLPRQTRKRAYAYIKYMSEQGWPRDDLLPFIVSQLQKPHDLAVSARHHLSEQIERWRSHADIRGISFALIQCKDELEEARRDELVATMMARFATTPVEMSAKAWGLLALSGLQGIAKTDLDNFAESLLDELAQDRLVNNEITPTVRLINQFPFSTPTEIARRVSNLRQRGYAPARRIKKVSQEGVLIDLFDSPPDEPWSFALLATQVAFVVYALIATGYYEIVGFPAHYRTQLEESVEKYVDLQVNKATTIPIKLVIWCNVFAIFTMLQFGGAIGVLIAGLSGRDLWNGCLTGVALVAVMFLSRVFDKGVGVFTHEFVIVGMWDWIRKQIERLLGALGK